MYTITLADGTKLENLELNGNNYISDVIIDDSVFECNLDIVTITDGETTEMYTDMRLMSNIVRDGRSWLVLGEKSPQYKMEEAIRKLMNNKAQNGEPATQLSVWDELDAAYQKGVDSV